MSSTSSSSSSTTSKSKSAGVAPEQEQQQQQQQQSAHERRAVSRRNFLIVFCTGLGFMTALLIGRIAYSLLFDNGHSADLRRCFAIDMLEHRVPDWQVPKHRAPGGALHHERPPVAFGKLCFDRQQLIVEWRFDQSFTRLYEVKDLLLRGPLENREATAAPSVLTLSCQTNKRNQFHGSTIIDRHLLQAILEHPRRYYVSLEATDEHASPPTIREVARHNLNYAI